MLFERFEDPGLSQYSYAVGCPAAGEMAIVDPRRDVDVYLDFAQQHGLSICAVLETHIHADFASGARELVARTGAGLLVSGHDRGETYEVRFSHENLEHGSEIEIGSVRLVAVHTPGHTPEHLSFLVYDTTRSEATPMILLSGDFLFVGSLGRPDLLGEEAKRKLAGQLFDSVRGPLAELPDGLEVHPAHGAGSMCGSGMSGRPTSTLGFERVANPYLDPALDRAAFIDRILGDVPPFPPYYKRMKRVNSEGPQILGALPGKRAVSPRDFEQLLGAGHLVIDVRDHLSWGGAHIPGSFAIGAGGKLSTWAAWAVPYERPLLLVLAHPDQRESVVRQLVRVGLDDVRGYLDGGIEAWLDEGLPVAETVQMSSLQLHERLEAGEALPVVDVRSEEEWKEGHIAGAIHAMAGEIEERLDALPAKDSPLAVICGSGYRSTVAASLLERHGYERVINISGGMGAWKQRSLPMVTED